jgi:asparagine synthase (glutamine-hydrolysing)
MCGITGWIQWRRDLRNEKETIERMAKTLEHRGPEDLNTWVAYHAALGHTRLVVVDPEGGCQPMIKTYGGRIFTIVYNGELYNTEELRQRLHAIGYRFRGHSDTVGNHRNC